MKALLIIGALDMAIAIMFGAFGAHGLKGRVSDHYISSWNTAAQYQLFHALGLILVAVLGLSQGLNFNASGWTLLVGSLLFSGSLYLLVLSGIKPIGIITPIGGLVMMSGWLLFAIQAFKQL